MNILQDIKLGVGVPVDSDAFDSELLMHANATAGFINQLGVTEFDGLVIREETEWPTITSPLIDSLVKAYLMMTVKSVFDPTASATIRDHIADYMHEIEYRILVETEGAT